MFLLSLNGSELSDARHLWLAFQNLPRAGSFRLSWNTASFQATFPIHRSGISHLRWQERHDHLVLHSKTLPFFSCKFHLDQDQLAFYPFHFQYSLGLCNIIKKYFSTACLRKLQTACDIISRIGNSPRCFMSCAFLLSPLSESPRHLNQNFSSSFFSEGGFLPAKEAPGISSSVSITCAVSSEALLEDAIFFVLWSVNRGLPASLSGIQIQAVLRGCIYEFSVYLQAIILPPLGRSPVLQMAGLVVPSPT